MVWFVHHWEEINTRNTLQRDQCARGCDAESV